MIAFLRGTVVSASESGLILDVHGVGYQISVSARDLAALPARGKEVQVFTSMSVGQDAIRLYGFLSADDQEVFRLLINVSGVGPKAALGILSALTADDLRFAVLSDDAKTIARAPGIGAKTAKKVILELKDRFSLEETFEHKLASAGAGGTERPAAMTDAKEEAVQALVALGYSSSDALRAVSHSDVTEDMDTETVLKLALRQMTNRQTGRRYG